VKHIGQPAADYLFFADQTEVKRLEYVPKKSAVFLVLAQSRCLILRRFMLAACRDRRHFSFVPLPMEVARCAPGAARLNRLTHPVGEGLSVKEHIYCA
jgi:hypothetical protein